MSKDISIDNTFFSKVETSMFGPPRRPGVYAICVKKHDDCFWQFGLERIIYIGSAKNVSARILNPNHVYRKCYSRFKNAYVYTRVFDCENYRELEKELIKIYRPLLNKQYK